MKVSLAQYHATLGDEKAAYALLAEIGTLKAGLAEAPPDLSGARAEPALEVIARAARDRRIVVLNEAHYSSRSRAFAAAVVERLRAETFDGLLAEAFTPQPADVFEAMMAAGKPVTGALGGYVCDPMFADLVRIARGAGYRLGTYEATAAQRAPAGSDRAASIAAREQAQAENIAAWLARHPGTRVLILCGHSHVVEAPLGPNIWMAARLKALTGEDPLTIDQTQALGGVDEASTSTAVQAVQKAFAPDSPVILRRADGSAVSPQAYAGAVDLTVFHPLVADVEGRPGWLAGALGRQKRVFALPKLEDAPYLLVQAVPLSEAADPGALPSDQYRLRPGATRAVFHLRPGVYEVRIETDAGRRVLGRI